jgi:uncharacterized membrane protein
MAQDVQTMLRKALINALDGGDDEKSTKPSSNGSPLSGAKGMAFGAGAAALAPLAAKKLAESLGMGSVGQLLKSPGQALGGVTSSLGDHVGSGLGDKVTQKVDQEGGASGILADTVRDVLPFGGGGGPKNNADGVGKGRRMPVQQSVDIGVPIETVYNQFTQFEDWPQFMHRVKQVSQEDDCTLSFTVKIWARSKEFTAKIETQRPNERIKWKVSHGIAHTGVVTFHELGPRLTRVLLNMDIEPGFPLEKAARGLRHVKRAARADLHRFKALIEMSEQETGAWRGVIEDGELVEEHDPSYDEDREYADIDDLVNVEDDSDSEDDDEDEETEDSEEEETQDEEPEEEEPEDEEPEEEQPRSSKRRSDSGRARASSTSRRSGSSHNGGERRRPAGQSRRS